MVSLQTPFFVALALLGAVSAQAQEATPALPAQEVVPPEVLAKHDYSLAETPNERTALAYLYTAWNDGQLVYARKTYWVPDANFSDPPGSPLKSATPPKGLPPAPEYTIKKVISEGDHVVVLAFIKGFGIGQPAITQMGPSKEPKIGDAVVEIFKFAPNGLIERKWDTIEPLTESTYDFR